ncbi:MAG TPA: hypothetical protein VIH17_01380 [Candidatus Acidoferrales bacterium]
MLPDSEAMIHHESFPGEPPRLPKKIPGPTRGRNIYSSHGRGIYLMRKAMDEVRFQRSGSRVVLKKRRR